MGVIRQRCFTVIAAVFVPGQIRVELVEHQDQTRKFVGEGIFARADQIRLYLPAAFVYVHVDRPAHAVLIEAVAESVEGMIDGSRAAFTVSRRVAYGKARSVLFHGVILAEADVETVDGYRKAGAAERLRTARYAVDGLLTGGILPRCKADYQEQHPKMRYPAAPHAYALPAGRFPRFQDRRKTRNAA